MNTFINTIKYSVLGLVLVIGFSALTPQAQAGWVDTTGDVFYDVVEVVVNAGPNKSYSLAAGATTKPSVTLTTNATLGVDVKDDQNVVVSTTWTKLSGPTTPTVTITNGTTLTPTFGNLSEDITDYTQNVYEFKLAAFNAAGVEVGSDTMFVSMTRENPKALAEEDATINVGDQVQLSGLKSKDMDAVGGDISPTGYTWTLVSGGGTIVSPNSATTTVRDLPVGRNVFRLRVVDLDGLADSTTSTVEGADADSPYTDDITITVRSAPLDVTAWLDILPDFCEIQAGQTRCMIDADASWGTTNATSARFFREIDNQTLSTDLNNPGLRINEYINYPSKLFKLVANDDDINTAEVSVNETVYARCVSGYIWGGTPSRCIVDTPPPPVVGACGPTLNSCNAGSSVPDGTSTTTWYCRIGGNPATDSTKCSVSGDGGGDQCNDKLDNDLDTRIDSLDPSCHSNCNANDASSYVPTGNEDKICLKPIYKQF